MNTDGHGDWGLGIGDWGLGIGDWAQSPSPIPNPQSPIPMKISLKECNILIYFCCLFDIQTN
jgi:hypothetical protein